MIRLDDIKLKISIQTESHKYPNCNYINLQGVVTRIEKDGHVVVPKFKGLTRVATKCPFTSQPDI